MRLQTLGILAFCCFIFLSSSNPIVTDEVKALKKQEIPKDYTFDGILKINQEASESFYEGDIVMPKTRNAMKDESHRWALEIPYTLDDQFSSGTKNEITAVLQEIEVRTCFTFVERQNEVDYMSYEKGDGCYSSVGMNGGGQTISIGGGCDTHRTIMHETFHALGFWHEQSRTDRDYNVQIVWDVIAPGKEHNFNKYDETSINLQGMPYDYDSILHYSNTAFSKNGSRTIIGLFEGSESMGRLDMLSKIDVMEMNKFYECQMQYDSSGFTEWTAWSPCDIQCVTVRDRYCDADSCTEWGKKESQSSGCADCVVGYDPDCGPTILNNLTGTVQSPLFPNNYKSFSACVNTIQAPEGARIHLSFQVMDVEHFNGDCYYDFVQVHDGADTSARQIGTYCGIDLPSTIISSGNTLTLNFTSDFVVEMGGYMAKYFITNSPMHYCAFENYNDLCDWTQDATADVEFAWTSGPTESDFTGPPADHTFGTEYGHYLYLEASSPTVTGNKARVISPMFEPSSHGYCFSMWYNMYGSYMGTMNGYLVTDGIFSASPIFSFSGDLLNDDWHQVYYPTTTSKEFQVAIEAIRDSGYKGDMAIDDVMLEEGPCPVP